MQTGAATTRAVTSRTVRADMTTRRLTTGHSAGGEPRPVSLGRSILVELFQLERQHVQTAFQLGDAIFERLLRRAGRLLEQQIDSGSSHFGDASDTVRKAQVPELFILFRSKAETDHPASGFNHDRRVCK